MMSRGSVFGQITKRCTVALAWLFLSPSIVSGYSEPIHKQLVLDAFEFIISGAKDTSRYADGSTGEDDYQTVVSVLAKAGGGNSRIRALAEEIGDASAHTDRRTDVWLSIPGLGSTPRSHDGGVYFTTFSHFVNVHTPGVLWKFSGYHYGWVEANQKCSEAGFEDKIANFFVAHGSAHVDVAKTEALKRYKDPLLPGIGVQDYEKHFDQRVKHAQFWPATNLAAHWFTQFIKSPRATDEAPYNLPYIGPPLHVVADSTVPYHAAGLSGCGHGVYEDNIETWNKTAALYDPKLVRRYLVNEPYLKATREVAEIIAGNARRAADRIYCKCTLLSCDCAVARNERAAKELVNLAIASSVVMIRKSFSEWAKQGGVLKADARPRMMTSDGEWRAPFYKTIAEVPITAARVASSDFAAASRMEKELSRALATMKDLVRDVEGGKLPSDPFRKEFEAAVSDVAAVVDKFPGVEWNPLPPRAIVRADPGFEVALDPPFRFRLPSRDEILGDSAWNTYRTQRWRFFQALGLYQIGIFRGAIGGRLPRVKEDERQRAREYLANLEKAQEAYVLSLGQGPK